MSTAFFTIYSLAHIAILIQAIRIRSGSRWPIWVLFLVTEAALVYDNAIIVLGHLLGDGALLYWLNGFRFLAHALLTPTLVLIGFNLLKRAGVRWSTNQIAQVAVCLAMTALIAFGVFRLFSAQLEVTREFGVLRYHDIAEQGPPIAPIVTIVLLIVWGGVLWRQAKWAWLCLAAIVMFISAAVPPSLVGPVVGSGGEVILAIGILATESLMQQREHADDQLTTQLRHA